MVAVNLVDVLRRKKLKYCKERKYRGALDDEILD